MPLTTDEQSALEALDWSGYLQSLAELVSIPSLSGDEAEAQRYMARLLADSGLEVDQWEIDMDKVAAHPAYSAEVERPEPLGVVGSLGRGEGPTLILNGHVDVVPAGEPDNWTVPPWKLTVRDGFAYGRGTLDMKGALLCAVFAARAIADAGLVLNGALQIQSVIGEEDGGCGTLATILRGHTGDAAIVLEPTEMAVAPAQAGALNFRIVVPGKAAHGALRQEGVDPIAKFIPIFQGIQALEKERNEGQDDTRFADYRLPYPICIGQLEAGVWASTVAETLICSGRYGVRVDEDLTQARAQLERRVADVARQDPWLRKHPPRVTWWGGQFAPAAIPADHPLVDAVTAAARDGGGFDPAVRGMPYGADMRLLVNQGGIPTILFGPGDVRKAHQPDEAVPLSDLRQVMETLVVLALRYCRH